MANPNVLLITYESWRAGPGALHTPAMPAPNLENLAAHGLRFTQAIAPANETLPALVSLLWGLPPHRHGVWHEGDPLPPADAALPALLREHGMHTAACGPLPDLGGVHDACFDHWYRTHSTSDAAAAAEEAGDQAVRAIQPVHQPFFLWTHLPACPQTDTQIGRILAALTARGITHNVVCLTACGGAPDAPPTAEARIRVPFILAGVRNQRKGTETDALLQLDDVLPTLAALCNAAGPVKRTGISLLPLLAAPGTPFRPAAVCQPTPDVLVARTARYKLVQARQSEDHAFYDLEADPQELQNLYHTPKGAAIREALARYLPTE